MKITDIMAKIKKIIDNDPDITTNYPTLAVTTAYYSDPVTPIVTDFPYITLRYIDEITEEVIGRIVDIDPDGHEVEGMFKEGIITAYCWDDDKDDTTDLADYVKKALFKMRDEYEDDGLLDIFRFKNSESIPSKGPFGGYRAICEFRVWVREDIDIIV